MGHFMRNHKSKHAIRDPIEMLEHGVGRSAPDLWNLEVCQLVQNLIDGYEAGMVHPPYKTGQGSLPHIQLRIWILTQVPVEVLQSSSRNVQHPLSRYPVTMEIVRMHRDPVYGSAEALKRRANLDGKIPHGGCDCVH